MSSRVAFIGGSRYSNPLEETSEKKFRALSNSRSLFVIGFGDELRLLRFVQHARFYLIPQLPVPIVRYLLLFVFGSMIAVWCIFRHRVRVLVAQSPYEGFIAAWTKLLARWAGKKVALVVESHGDFENALFVQRRVFSRKIIRWLMNRIARFALYHADVLRAISTPTREQLASLAPDRPAVQFPAWTDMDIFLKAGQGKDHSDDPVRYILYAGALTPLKGTDVLVDAFRGIAVGISDVQLWLVGKKQSREYAEMLMSNVEERRLSGRVIFRDEVPQVNLAAHMAKAEVFVLPSLSEGLGRVVFEAMACGTTVIGSRVGGIPELIEDGVTGFLVPPGDKDALEERLKWVLSHPEKNREMGKKARERAREIFSTDAYVQNYEKLFRMAEEAITQSS